MQIDLESISTSQYFKIAYKLIHDSLFLIILFFLGALILEGILPGIISDRFGIYNIIILAATHIFVIAILQKKFSQTFPPSSTVRLLRGKIFWTFIFILFALILNGLIGLNLFLIPVFVFIIAAIIYFSYKVFFEEARNKE